MTEEQKKTYVQKNLGSPEQCLELMEVLWSHENLQGVTFCGSAAETARAIFREYQDKAVEAISGLKHFKEDLLVYLRALVLVLEMTGNAETHREKGARLRGAVELLEQMIERLRLESFEMNLSRAWMRDFMRSDFPTRAFKERIRELESLLTQAATTRSAHAIEPNQPND